MSVRIRLVVVVVVWREERKGRRKSGVFISLKGREGQSEAIQIEATKYPAEPDSLFFRSPAIRMLYIRPVAVCSERRRCRAGDFEVLRAGERNEEEGSLVECFHASAVWSTTLILASSVFHDLTLSENSPITPRERSKTLELVSAFGEREAALVAEISR